MLQVHPLVLEELLVLVEARRTGRPVLVHVEQASLGCKSCRGSSLAYETRRWSQRGEELALSCGLLLLLQWQLVLRGCLEDVRLHFIQVPCLGLIVLRCPQLAGALSVGVQLSARPVERDGLAQLALQLVLVAAYLAAQALDENLSWLSVYVAESQLAWLMMYVCL